MLLLVACASTTIDTAPVVGHPGLAELSGVRAALDEDRLPRLGTDYTEPGVFWSQDLAGSADCAGAHCARIGTALFSPVEGDAGVLVVVDFDPEPSDQDLNLVLAVDRSGSMGADRLNAVRQGLGLRATSLDEGDLASLISFADTAKTEQPPRPMEASERQALQNALFLDAEGGTDVVAGLEAAFSEAAKNHGRGRTSHVVLVTDDPSDSDAILDLARTRGVAGIGLTAVGAGNHLGPELAWELERVPGGRMIYADLDDLEERLGSDLVPSGPLDLEMRPAEGWEVVDTWLLDHSGDDALAQARLGAVFSGRARAFVLRPTEGNLTALPQGTALGSLVLGEDIVDVVAADTDSWAFTTIHADDLGTFRFAALIDEALALAAAEDSCSGLVEASEAAALAEAAALRLDAAALILDDVELDLGASLAREAARMEELAVLVEEGC